MEVSDQLYSPARGLVTVLTELQSGVSFTTGWAQWRVVLLAITQYKNITQRRDNFCCRCSCVLVELCQEGHSTYGPWAGRSPRHL